MNIWVRSCLGLIPVNYIDNNEEISGTLAILPTKHFASKLELC